MARAVLAAALLGAQLVASQSTWYVTRPDAHTTQF
jgi:hypothetical protein